MEQEEALQMVRDGEAQIRRALGYVDGRALSALQGEHAEHADSEARNEARRLQQRADLVLDAVVETAVSALMKAGK